MKKSTLLLSGIMIAAVFVVSASYAADPSPLDWLKSKVAATTATKLSDTEIGSGLKEALRVGIENTIKLLGKQDGYLANQAVKILLPKGIQNAEPVLRKMGIGAQLDEFILSMNRAAEKAAPVASDIFASAITDMSFDDANKILSGGNTAATDYLKKATSAKLLAAFQPAVSTATNEYQVTRKYQELLSKVQSLPLVNKAAGNLDINKYVCARALDGLFKVLGQEEANIRTNPTARVTDLLKKVFSK
jgi:hypothetical protein